MTQLQKYTWLIETIRRYGQISHKDLSDCWERNDNLSEGRPLARSTFNRWREAIEAEFGVKIGCRNDGGYVYFLENPEDIREDQLKKWMLDAYAVGSLISENLSLKDRILVDEIPSGRDYLTVLIDAMKQNRYVEITYRADEWDGDRTFTSRPYSLKLFQNCWYLLGYSDDSEKCYTYGLDRIKDVKVLDKTFKMPKDFSADKYFAPFYGIWTKDEKPERIVLRAYDNHGEFLKRLPLHWSQEEIGEGENHIDFSLYLVPTPDFVMRLLQMGSLVEVLKPQSLRDEMKKWIDPMYEYYNEK